MLKSNKDYFIFFERKLVRSKYYFKNVALDTDPWPKN